MILNEKCSAAIIQEIPTKIEDLGGLTIPCEFKNSKKTNALADLGARVNLMSYSFYHKLNLQELEFDMKEDEEVAIIIVRPSLSTARALVDIRDSKLTLRVDDEEITFRVYPNS
uniref:Aspartic peptidase DDI1-type domain-containing protein n=1 Tax=Lactuca sativa TaxID=4236 RepID=A0A9R1VMX1_LACSA|nr:hypothetical protein LSAT_V11C500246170 [Lactuca sativa]